MSEIDPVPGGAPETLWVYAADGVLVIHALFVLFVVFALVLVIIGGVRGWSWVRNPGFRLAHVAAIGVVVLQSWAGVICPLTTWEMRLRSRAGDSAYSGTFIGHWLERVLYYQAPPWVFVVCYSTFALLVLACWWWVRPRAPRGWSKTRWFASREDQHD